VLLAEQHVVGLDVTVHDAVLVDVVERVGELAEDVERALDRHRTVARREQRLALDELHHHVGAERHVLAEVDDRHDVRMRDLTREPRLVVEALPRVVVIGERRCDHLQGEDLAELDVACSKHLPHPTFCELRLQHVATTRRLPCGLGRSCNFCTHSTPRICSR
jgi:hypothetical protein